MGPFHPFNHLQVPNVYPSRRFCLFSISTIPPSCSAVTIQLQSLATGSSPFGHPNACSRRRSAGETSHRKSVARNYFPPDAF